MNFFKNKNEKKLTDFNSFKFNHKDYSEQALLNVLNRIVRDAINPIELKREEDANLMSLGSSFIDLKEIQKNKINKEEEQEDLNKIEKDKTLLINATLQEIVVSALYQDTTAVKCRLTNRSNLFLLNPVIDEKKGLARINNLEFEIIDGFYFAKIIHDKELLLKPFKLISDYYNQIEFFSQKSNIIFLKKEGLNAFANSAKPAELAVFFENAQKTLKDFEDNRGGIIDNKDDFSILQTSIAGITEAINFATQEVARLLGMPVSILTGENPSGLNSGGVTEFIAETYERILDYYLKRIVEPLLKGLKVDYVISGLTPQGKLNSLRDFSAYALNLEATSDKLFKRAVEIQEEILQ